MIAVLIAGCASPDVNPPAAQSHVGYVDFYAANADSLSWQVTDTAQNKILFSEIDSLADGILRLALPPGHYQLRVTFLNHVVVQPAVVAVDVSDGKITPVSITLVENGQAQVRERNVRAGGTYYGRYGRGTRITDTSTLMFVLEAEAQPAVAYQTKEQMPYGKPTSP